MSRGFTEEERKEIKNKLIDLFIEKLNYQKISSINIDDLVKSVGIAKGSFYLFFKSKDELFAAVLNHIQSEIVNESIYLAEEKDLSDKKKLKAIVLFLINTIKQYPWIKKLSNVEYEKIIRRLPRETKENLRTKDITDIQNILEKLNLKSDYSSENIVIMIQIILSSALNSQDYGPQYDQSVEMMVDILINNLF
ncbi:TetR/AcrR family transcriptional regulator [Lactobacillus sp. DCY120]|uniref:TetR/AcrR family transcriptional regulator n=1 Tax=Bombilactobacillus apium TaxID=2675299 RepID=A0A850R599_9LACO|nr:TetR/AcrR family transcriptional regulator [Bombilactobacillus apium]NVY96027.1 TetR/AcrR family transcriptional regulator [Bombilactobacillus apium]